MRPCTGLPVGENTQKKKEKAGRPAFSRLPA